MKATKIHQTHGKERAQAKQPKLSLQLEMWLGIGTHFIFSFFFFGFLNWTPAFYYYAHPSDSQVL